MSDRLKMLRSKTFEDSRSTISSPASAAGPTHSGLRAGRIPVPFGLEAVHANLSARQAKEKGLLTSGTYGLHGTGSSKSIILTLCLANRLRARTASLGSTLYRLTWKVKTTPSRRSYSQLVASVRPWVVRGFGLFPCPTPRATDGEKGIRTNEGIYRERTRRKNGYDLSTWIGGRPNPQWVAWLMGFPHAWDDCGVTAMRSFRGVRKKS